MLTPEDHLIQLASENVDRVALSFRNTPNVEELVQSAYAV